MPFRRSRPFSEPTAAERQSVSPEARSQVFGEVTAALQHIHYDMRFDPRLPVPDDLHPPFTYPEGFGYNPLPARSLLDMAPDWLEKEFSRLYPHEAGPRLTELVATDVGKLDRRLQLDLAVSSLVDDIPRFSDEAWGIQGKAVQARIAALGHRNYGPLTPEDRLAVADTIAPDYVNAFAAGGPHDPAVRAYNQLVDIVGYPVEHRALHGMLAVDLYARAAQGQVVPDRARQALEAERDRLTEALKEEQLARNLSASRTIADISLVTSGVAQRMAEAMSRARRDPKRLMNYQLVAHASGYNPVDLLAMAAPAMPSTKAARRAQARRAGPIPAPAAAHASAPSVPRDATDPTAIPGLDYQLKPMTSEDAPKPGKARQRAVAAAVGLAAVTTGHVVMSDTAHAQESGRGTYLFAGAPSRGGRPPVAPAAPTPAPTPETPAPQAPEASQRQSGTSRSAAPARIQVSADVVQEVRDAASQARPRQPEAPNSIDARRQELRVLEAEYSYYFNQDPTATTTQAVDTLTRLWQHKGVTELQATPLDTTTTQFFERAGYREWLDGQPAGNARLSVALLSLGARYPQLLNSDHPDVKGLFERALTFQAPNDNERQFFEWYSQQRGATAATKLFGDTPSAEYSEEDRQDLVRLFVLANFYDLDADQRQAAHAEYLQAREAAAAAEAERRAEAEAIARAEAEARARQEATNDSSSIDVSGLPDVGRANTRYGTTTSVEVPNAQWAINRVRHFTNTPEGQREISLTCSLGADASGGCNGMCGRAAANIWGYRSAGFNAWDQWKHYRENMPEITRPGDLSPPIGALVFWRGNQNNSGYGHVGVYVGDGRVATNITTDDKYGVLPMEYFGDRYYLGWSLPHYTTARL